MKTAKTKKRNFSPAQLRAQARFAKAAKAGTLKRKKRNTTIIKAKKISHLDVSKVHNGLAASKKRKPAKKNSSYTKYAFAIGRAVYRLEHQATRSEILKELTSEYELTPAEARKALAAAIERLKKKNPKRKPAAKKANPRRQPKFKVGAKVYSYQNETYKAPVIMVKPSDDAAFAHKYKLQLKGQKSNWIDEQSLSRTKKNPRRGMRKLKGTVKRGERQMARPYTAEEKRQFTAGYKVGKRQADELTGTKNPRRGTRRLTARYKKLRTEARKGTGSGALLNEKMAKTGKIIATRHLRGKRQASAVTKRNGSHTSLARKRREEFVGRPSTKLKTLYAPNGSGASGTLSQLGKLHKIKVKGGKEYNFKGVPVLAQHPKTDQLFVLGKNYTVNVPRKNPGDRLVDLGEVRTIEYEAVKTHLGDTAPVRYYNHFGEEGGERPHALVNEEGLIMFSGGDYYIRPEGIRD